MEDRIKFPFGAATIETPAYAATISITAWNNKTQVKPAQLTGNAAFNIVPDAEVEIGAEVLVQFNADATNRTVTMGANMEGPAIAVNASETVNAEFVWNGTKFTAKAVAIVLN